MEINGHNLCIGCMNELDNSIICPICGLNQSKYAPVPRCLIPGTNLNERYWIGKVIGEGSFGITYLGWDSILAIPVAIKEFYPSDFVSRDVLRGKDKNVYTYGLITEEDYHKQLDNFLNEAKSLIQFNQLEAIVSVKDFFYENNTAYMVMEYVEGENLKQYIRKHGPMDAEKVMEAFRPVLEDLVQIHKVGLVHRDISPDNILIDEEGKLTLIDFGAAKLQNADLTRSITIVFKRGFSPEEQYRTKGKQGAWTDVYAICSSIYFAMTGVVPDEAIQRTIEDHVRPLYKFDSVKLSQSQCKTIEKGMAVRAEHRFQAVEEFLHAYDYAMENEKRKRKWMIIIILVVGVLLYWCIFSWHQQNEYGSPQTQDTAIEHTTAVRTSEASSEVSTEQVTTTEVTTESTTEQSTVATMEITTEAMEQATTELLTTQAPVAPQSVDSATPAKSTKKSSSKKAEDELDGFIN